MVVVRFRAYRVGRVVLSTPGVFATIVMVLCCAVLCCFISVCSLFGCHMQCATPSGSTGLRGVGESSCGMNRHLQAL